MSSATVSGVVRGFAGSTTSLARGVGGGTADRVMRPTRHRGRHCAGACPSFLRSIRGNPSLRAVLWARVLEFGPAVGVRPRAPRGVADLEHIRRPVADLARDVAHRADDDPDDAADVRCTRLDHDLDGVLARLESVEGVAHAGRAAAGSSWGRAWALSPSGSGPPRPGRGGSASLTILRTTLPNCLGSGPALYWMP